MSTRKDVFRLRECDEYLEVYENWHTVSLCFGDEELIFNREELQRLIQNLVDLEKRI